jgi:Flp pilus assembly protein TadD
VANALTSYLRYPGKLFWPTDLAAIYPYRRLDDWLQTSVIALILASISAFVCLQFRRRPWLAVGWFWYLITALPIIGLVQVGETAMADRYTYLPLIGPVIALVWLIPETWTRTVFTRGLLSLGIAAGLAGLVGLTRHQIQYWHDTDRLFSHTLAVTGDNAGAEAGRGYGLEHEGRLSEAVGHFSKAMWLNPEDREYRLKTGELLSQLGEWSEAADTLSVLLGKNPNDVGAHEDLGSALSHLRRYAEARQHWETALRFAPDDPRVLNNLAWLLATCPEARVRDGREAVALAEHACTLTQFKTTRFMGTLAAAQAEAGRFDDAIATARKACDLAAAHGETELFQRNQALLALYKKHQPWHEPANGP